MTAETSVCAKYKSVEGWHVFHSDELPGLYVASRDPARAFNDVAPAIQMLLKLDEGVDCQVIPELPLDAFLSSIKGHGARCDGALEMSDKRFSLMGVAA